MVWKKKMSSVSCIKRRRRSQRRCRQNWEWIRRAAQVSKCPRRWIIRRRGYLWYLRGGIPLHHYGCAGLTSLVAFKVCWSAQARKYHIAVHWR